MLTASSVRWFPPYATHLPFCNNQVQVVTDRNGKRHVFGVPYSSEGLSSVFLVDPENGNTRKFPIPGEEHGAYCDVAGTDGRIYLGTFKGKLLAFDPANGQFEELCWPFEGQYPWGGLATKSGKIFCGATPSGSFIVWDITTKRIEYTETRKFSGNVYANCFSELPDGRVLIGVGGAEQYVGIYDPERKSTDWQQPEWLKGSTFIYAQGNCDGQLLFRTFPGKELLFIRPEDLRLTRRIEGVGYYLCTLRNGEGRTEVWGVDSLTGNLYVLKDNTFKHVATPVPYEGGWLCAIGPRTLATITVEGTYATYNADTKKTFSKPLSSNQEGGMRCSALESDGHQRLFIAPFINQRVVQMDLRDGSSREVGRVAEHPGQVPVMKWHRGKLYMAYYTSAGLSVYDPQQPYVFRENPKVLGLVGDEQYRPTGRMAAIGNRLYYTTKAMYGKLGGAIVALDTATDKWQVFRHVIKDQNLTGLIQEPVTGLMFTSSEIAGDCGSCLPTAKAAEWAAWDPKTQKRVGGAALEACEGAIVLEAIGDGRVLLQKEYAKQIWLIDAAKLTLVEPKVPLPAEDVRPIDVLLRASDSQLYGIGGGHLFRWNPKNGETEKLLKIEGRCLIEASPGRLIFNDKARIGEYRFD